MRENYESHPTYSLISKRIELTIEEFMNAIPNYELKLDDNGKFVIPSNPAVSKLLNREFSNLGFTNFNGDEKALFIILLNSAIVKKIKSRYPKQYK